MSHPERYIFTGMSGTGKSALLCALAQSGSPCFEEVVRQVLKHQLSIDGPALPAKDPGEFVREMLRRSISDFEGAKGYDAPVFYDRGIPDMVAYARRFGVDPRESLDAALTYRYSQPVFVAPPWREIFHPDEFRGASFEQYVEFHDLILDSYQELGYTLVELPKKAISVRLRYVQSQIANRHMA